MIEPAEALINGEWKREAERLKRVLNVLFDFASRNAEHCIGQRNTPMLRFCCSVTYLINTVLNMRNRELLEEAIRLSIGEDEFLEQKSLVDRIIESVQLCSR